MIGRQVHRCIAKGEAKLPMSLRDPVSTVQTYPILKCNEVSRDDANNSIESLPTVRYVQIRPEYTGF